MQSEVAAHVLATAAGAHEAVLWLCSDTDCGQFGSRLALEMKVRDLQPPFRGSDREELHSPGSLWPLDRMRV